MSRTYLALLHYDGRDFAGWQRQARGRTVQGEFEGVLERLCGRRVVATAAGRTDAGVHAVGMGVSFSVPTRWSGGELYRALNALLPGDCWVQSVSAMQPGFQARRSAVGRRYRYLVGTDQASASPFRRPYEWPLARPIEPARMQEAARTIVGIHEFSAFAVHRREDRSERPHRCAIREAEWEARLDGTGYTFRVAADRFLHHMVRFLVGTMVDIGLGRRPVEDMALLLTRPDNHETSPPAPPQGLYFVAAEYPRDCYVEPAE